MKNILIAVGILTAFLLSCSEAKKLDKAKKTFDNHSLEASEYCYLKFPVEASIEYRPGKTITDTLEVNNWKLDTLYLQEDGTEKTRIITEIKYKTIYKRVVDTVFKSVENTARIKAFEARFTNSLALEKKQDELIKIQDEHLKHKSRSIIWLLVIIGLQSIYIFRKPLLKLFI